MTFSIKKLTFSLRRQKETSALLLLLVSLLPAGCTGYSTGFDCPIGEGLKCASLSEVNRRMDAGDLHLQPVPAALPEKKEDSPYPRLWKELSDGKDSGFCVSRDCPSCQRVYWRDAQKGGRN